MKRILFVLLLLFVPVLLGCAQSSSESEDAAEAPATTTGTTDASPATPFPWPSFDEAMATAKKNDKPILVDIYSPWCGWCRKMQAEVYSDADLQAYLNQHFSYGRLNIDDNQTRHTFKDYELTSQELGYGLGAEGTPTTVFLDSNGDYITRLPGYADLETFSQVLRYIGSGAYQEQTYEAFREAGGTQ